MKFFHEYLEKSNMYDLAHDIDSYNKIVNKSKEGRKVKNKATTYSQWHVIENYQEMSLGSTAGQVPHRSRRPSWERHHQVSGLDNFLSLTYPYIMA